MIKTIIFDNNGVLVTSNEETGFNAITKETGLDTGEFKPVYDELAKNVDKGQITTAEFFREIVRRFGLKIDSGNLQDIIYGSFVRKEETISFVKNLKDKYEIALLTNFGDAFWGLDKEWRVTELFDKDKVFLSCEMKMRKPDPDIFLKTLRTLKRRPEETIFIDDKKENIKAAEKLGIIGIIFKNVDQLKQELKKYITI